MNKTQTIKEGDKPNSFWQDRILLESLISQILPGLIISDPKKADEILAFIKEGVSLPEFLEKYPEFDKWELKVKPDLTRTLNFINQENEDNFFPIVDFNHDILYYLTEIIKTKKLLSISDDDLNYQFQLRVVLYKNFNRYLNLLLSKLGAKKAEVAAQALLGSFSRQEFLKVLSTQTGETPNDLIDNFFNLKK